MKRKLTLQKLGGHFQLSITSADELDHMCTLDKAHWMATIAPSGSLICDPVFLKFMDSDGNGAIRSDELKNAWKWLSEVLNDYQAVTDKRSELALSTINEGCDAGKKVLASARQVIQNLGLQESKSITLEQTRSRQDILSAAECNGDGIIPPEATDDEAVVKLINDIMNTVGSAEDLSGAKGASEELLNSFLEKIKGFLEWTETGHIPIDKATTEIMCRGENTPAKSALIEAVEPKVEEFFLQCQLLAVDEGVATRFSMDPDALTQLDVTDAEAVNQCMQHAVLAQPNTDNTLPFDSINPAYADKVDALAKEFFPEAEGLTKDQWQTLKAEFKAYRDWVAAKAGAEVEPLGIDRLKEIMQAPPEIERLRKLIAYDKSVADELEGIADLERTILYQRWLIDLANNFISFNQLFNPATNSLIQAGVLIMDGRHFDLNVKVTDRAKHKKTAGRSNICTMYLKLTRKKPESDDTMEIATAVTSGNMVYLYVGKTGIFVDTKGEFWDAEVLDIITHPVSITEALKMPFVKLAEFIKKQVDKFTASRYKEMEDGLGKSIDQAEKSLVTPGNQPAPGAAQPQTAGGGLSFLMLGGGLSLAAVGSSFAYMTKALKDVSYTHIFMVFAGVFAIIALPIVIVALIKLRKRNLGMFLEAGGWAINSPMRLTHRMGLLFTRVPAYPDDAVFKRFEQIRSLIKQAPTYKRRLKLKSLIITLAALVCLVGGYYAGVYLFRDKPATTPPATKTTTEAPAATEKPVTKPSPDPAATPKTP